MPKKLKEKNGLLKREIKKRKHSSQGHPVPAAGTFSCEVKHFFSRAHLQKYGGEHKRGRESEMYHKVRRSNRRKREREEGKLWCILAFTVQKRNLPLVGLTEHISTLPPHLLHPIPSSPSLLGSHNHPTLKPPHPLSNTIPPLLIQSIPSTNNNNQNNTKHELK